MSTTQPVRIFLSLSLLVSLAACGGGGSATGPGGPSQVDLAVQESGWFLSHANLTTLPVTQQVTDWASGDSTNRMFVGFAGKKAFLGAEVHARTLMRFDLTGLVGPVTSAQLRFVVLDLLGDPSQIGGLEVAAVQAKGKFGSELKTEWAQDPFATVIATGAQQPSQKTGDKSAFVTESVNRALEAGETSIEFAFYEIDRVNVVDGTGDYYVIASPSSIQGPPMLSITR